MARTESKIKKRKNQMITAQHRKSSHQILQVSSKCPHTDNCTITAVKYLTAESYISIPEKKKKEKKKKLQQTGKLCFSSHLISHGHYPDFFSPRFAIVSEVNRIYILSNGGQSAQS